MALSTETNKKSFVAISGQTKFDFNIPYFETSDISVVRVDTDGTTTTLSYNASPSTATQFSVTATNSNTANGATITLGGTATTGSTYTVTRTVNLKQQYDLQEGSTIDPTALNKALDRVVAQNQQQEDTISTNTTNITTNTASIATNASNITSNDTDIATNASNIATNTSNISTNTANISTNTGNISTNTGNISTNTGNISTNTGNISTNTSNISANTSNISTNTSNIASNLTKINADIMQANTTVTITQSGGGSTTQCVVSGHTSATFNASDYNNLATETIQAAINSIPKNLSGHFLHFVFGTTSGQTIELESQIYFYDFLGGDVQIKSALTSDNESNSSGTKVNKIQSVDHPTSGDIIDRLWSINNCAEVYVLGLHLRYLSANTNKWITTNTANNNVDYAFCFVEGNGQVGLRGLYYQRGGQGMVRSCKFADMAYAIQANAAAVVNAQSNSWDSGLGNQPTYGHNAVGATILPNGTHVTGNTADYQASAGGLITNENGIILEETILTATKYVDIPAGTTGAEIRSIISDQPKFLNGNGLVFRFAAASAGSQNTYDLGNIPTYLAGFTGGNVIFQAYDFTANADVDESGTGSGTFRTKITGSTGDYNGIIQAGDSSADFFFNDLAFEMTGTNDNTEVIISRNATLYVDRCQFKGNEAATTNANPMGIRIARGFGIVTNSYFSDLYTAILADEASDVYAAENNDYGNAVLNGQTAQRGSKIGLSGTKVDGSVKDLTASTGGLIIPAGGVILSDQSGGGFGTSAEAVYGQTQL